MNKDILIELRPRQIGMTQVVNQVIERHLIQVIKEIEGRVPTNDEVAKHGFCGIFPDGRREFKWKEQTVLVALGVRYEAGKLAMHFDVPVKS